MHIFEIPFSHNYSVVCIIIHFDFCILFMLNTAYHPKSLSEPFFASRILTTSLKSILRGLASSLRRFKHPGVQLFHFELKSLRTQI